MGGVLGCGASILNSYMDPPPRAFSEVLPQPLRTSPQGSEKFGLGAQIATLPAKCTVRQTSQNLFQGSEKLLSELVRGVLRRWPRVLRSFAFLAFLTSGSKSEAIFRSSLPTTKRKREQVKVLKKGLRTRKTSQSFWEPVPPSFCTQGRRLC